MHRVNTVREIIPVFAKKSEFFWEGCTNSRKGARENYIQKVPF